MRHVTCRTYNSYKIGSSLSITDTQYKKLIENFTCSKISSGRGLEGRTTVTRIRLDGIGPIVIKHYRRGGLLGNFIQHLYLHIGKPRSRVEYEQLEKARGVGISAPEPICFAFRGKAFYTAWLVTREIDNQRSLAQLSMLDTKSAISAVKKLVPQILILMNNRIYHKDLHPGNVLVDENNDIYIIDFDKAGVFRGDKRVLLNKYMKRWGRAVTKHSLPQALYDTLRNEFME